MSQRTSFYVENGSERKLCQSLDTPKIPHICPPSTGIVNTNMSESISWTLDNNTMESAYALCNGLKGFLVGEDTVQTLGHSHGESSGGEQVHFNTKPQTTLTYPSLESSQCLLLGVRTELWKVLQQ